MESKNFSRVTAKQGMNLAITPFTQDQGRGVAGPTTALNFTVVREEPGLIINQFVLVNAITDFDRSVLSMQVRGTLGDTEGLNIRADVLGPARSVKFELEPLGITRIENVKPFALFGDINGDYFPFDFGPGEYSVTATAYRQQDAQGTAGEPATAEFIIFGSNSSINPELQSESKMSLLNAAPGEFSLDAAYPNPFNPTTTIRFSVPEASPISLTIYDMLGREIRTLVDEVLPIGIHEVQYDASGLPSGTYLYRLETPAEVFVKRVVLVK